MLLFNKFDLIRAISQVLDLANTILGYHHLRTAFITDQLCRRLPLKTEERRLAVLSALLHDLGGLPLGLSPDDLLFHEDLGIHGRTGWMLLQTCPQLMEESWVIRYHHLDWPAIQNLPEDRRRAGELGNLIHLANHLDVSARSLVPPRALRADLKAMAGRAFGPDYVEAARDLLFTPDLFPNLTEASHSLSLAPAEDLALSEDDFMSLAQLITKLIDSRSPFTAMHSTVVASLGLLLHQLAGGREEDTRAMYLAGLLHDVGKLGVPLNLIEKPGPLTEAEFAQVSEHARLSWQILSSLPGFYQVAVWGAYHHERLNGSGYPRGLSGNDLPMESRIIAVVDVFAALTENRPYRPGLSGRDALEALEAMASSRALDGGLVALVQDNLGYFSVLRRETIKENQAFLQGLADEIDISTQGQLPPAWRRVLDELSSLPG